MRFIGLLILTTLLGACAGSAVSPAPTSQTDIKRRTDIRVELATAYFTSGQTETALLELDRALELSPRRADVLGFRGLVLMQSGDNAGASRDLREALYIEPDNPSLQNNMGWFLCQSGEPEQAMAFFERALAAKNYASPSKALINAGLCRLRQGQRAAAENYFQRALEAAPSNSQAHVGLAQTAFESSNYTKARGHILKVIESEQATAEHFLMAVRIERKLGNAAAEQSLLAQWSRRFPESPQLTAYLQGRSDGK